VKRAFAVIAVLVAAVGVYVAAGPFITFHGMNSAIKARDPEKLSEYIDFPMLRTNLKEQVNAVIIKEAAAKMSENPFGLLGMGLAAKFAEGIVEFAITPSGLANLMQRATPIGPPKIATTEFGKTLATTEPFSNARYNYDSSEKFFAWVKKDNGGEIRFVLSRNWFSWKLTNIIVPLNS
jgi:hypothetical protein